MTSLDVVEDLEDIYKRLEFLEHKYNEPVDYMKVASQPHLKEYLECLKVKRE